jgi:hypothetical protein
MVRLLNPLGVAAVAVHPSWADRTRREPASVFEKSSSQSLALVLDQSGCVDKALPARALRIRRLIATTNRPHTTIRPIENGQTTGGLEAIETPHATKVIGRRTRMK